MEDLYDVVFCPLYNDPYYTYAISLSGVLYQMTFRWNSRLSQWILEIADADENKIIGSVGLVARYNLLLQYSLEAPPGVFYLVPIRREVGRKGSPSTYDIAEEYELLYIDRAKE